MCPTFGLRRPYVEPFNLTFFQTRTAEVKISTALAQHNVPLAFADALNTLIPECFPDSQIAQEYQNGKTKATCILNGAVRPHFKEDLIKTMKEEPFSVAIDGSNDKGNSF